MKKIVLCLMILLSNSCTMTFPRFPSLRQHADPFYNYDDSYAPGARFPLINPIDVTRESPSSLWDLWLNNMLMVKIPNSNRAYYAYDFVAELEKFAVKNGVVMAYSSYVDTRTDPSMQKIFYHWFVTVPGKNITKGFQAEAEFNQYIQTLGIKNPDWQMPDEAFDKYFQTGCLDWIPDCQ